MEPDAVRAGHADRERVVAQLNDAFAEGRLDIAELEERVAAAYAAKTIGELKPLTEDLPGGPAAPVPAPRRAADPAPPASSPPSGVVRRKAGADAAVRAVLGVFALNIAIWAAVSLGTGGLIYFWPVWLLIPLAGTLIGRAVGGHPRR